MGKERQNEKLFWKAWDKFREHPEEGHERLKRLAREKFGIDMMAIAALDIIKSMTGGEDGFSIATVEENVMRMSDAEVTMLISDFIFNHSGERPCPV